MKSIISAVIILLGLNCFAQDSNDQVTVIKGGSIQTMSIQSKPKETKGSCYYNDEWYIGTIKLFSGEEIQSYPLKYDMKMNQIDIKVNETVKIVSIGAVKEITWIKPNGKAEVLKNIGTFKGFEGYGFFSLISEGKITLLKKTNLLIMESNYNVTMDVGTKSDNYVKKDKYYVKTGDKISEVKLKKKIILKKFKENAEKVESYITENNLKLKDENDLKQIFDFYNNL